MDQVAGSEPERLRELTPVAAWPGGEGGRGSRAPRGADATHSAHAGQEVTAQRHRLIRWSRPLLLVRRRVSRLE